MNGLNGKVAVCVGATGGIGRAVALLLAQNKVSVAVVGRSVAAGKELLAQLKDHNPSGQHSFYSSDVSLLKNVRDVCTLIGNEYKSVNYCVLSQGIASIQGRTETTEGIDVKMSLHYYSRMQFILGLLPLMNSSNSDTGARVLSILSGGVHSPFIDRNDLELRKNYSIGNAANAAGFYNDLGLDVLSSQNPSISFIHAAPGFVRTEWGKSFPSYLKNPLRLMQSTLAKSPEDCAKCMVQGLTSSRFSPFTNKQNGETPTNIHIMNEKGLSGSVTNAHTEEVN